MGLFNRIRRRWPKPPSPPPDPTCAGCPPYGSGMHHQDCTYMKALRAQRDQEFKIEYGGRKL